MGNSEEGRGNVGNVDINGEKSFEVKDTFGLRVLLKLTKKTVDNVDVFLNKDGSKLISNLSLGAMIDAVKKTVETHGIKFLVGGKKI